jgi:hypothetical protein
MGQENDSDDLYSWNKPKTFVCTRCLEDKYLGRLIRQSSVAKKCSYCKKIKAKNVATLSVLMESITAVFKRRYSDEAHSDCPYDKEAADLINHVSTLDALQTFADEISENEELLEDVANAFDNTSWVEAADGAWMSGHEHEELIWSWERFSRQIKHEQRFFFQQSVDPSTNQTVFMASEMLSQIGQLVIRHNLLRKIKTRTTLFRARLRPKGDIWLLDAEQLGVAPPHKACAGRMNPAGISYLYTAFKKTTAVAEITPDTSTPYVVSNWKTLTELEVVDLSKLPAIPSIFDEEKRREREALLFLYSFIADISKPVEAHENRDIEYVPTQVVSEYFAKVFRDRNGHPIHGIMYGSAKHKEGVNLVLFPSAAKSKDRFSSVKLMGHELS